MKRFIYMLAVLTAAVVPSFAQQADMQVGELINAGNWFELERVYPEVRDDVQTPMLKLMAEVMLASNFNRPDELREKLPRLMAEHQDELGFENVCNMTIMGAIAEGFAGNYGVAADMVKSVADAVKAATGSLEGTGIAELTAYYDEVRELPAPELEKPDTDVKIALSEKSGLLWIPVDINGRTYDFIFDTGASASLISRNLANEIGAEFIGESVWVGGATGGGTMQRAFVEKVNAGPVLFRNVLVFIGDNPSENDPVKVDAVLGMDFIGRLGEIQIDMTDLTLTVPARKAALPEYGRNIILDQNIPIVEAADSNGNKLTFTLDTGNMGADLTDLWSTKNAETVSHLSTETQNTWGHGGTIRHEIVKVPEYTLTIGDASPTFKGLPASIPAGDSAVSTHDGNLGMGLLKGFSRVTLSFDEMFLKLEK